MSLTQDEVLKIIQMVKDSNFEEMKLKIGDLEVVVNKHNLQNPVRMSEKESNEQQSDESKSFIAIDQKENIQHANKDQEPLEVGNLIPIQSPSHGIFYLSPSPGSPPFVELGSQVQPNNDIGIVEIMKLFSTIKAGVSGRIVKICAENEQQIEQGQTLFLVEPA